jgi:GT2 family glycosyltransferase
MQTPEFSIIIPAQGASDYLLQALEKISALKGATFEVIIVSMEKIGKDFYGGLDYEIKIVHSEKVGPAFKRNLGASISHGNFLAFLDDDAYPRMDWLEVALENLRLEKVSAIGGPQLTPREDSFWQKVSGSMFISFLSGSARKRYWPGKKNLQIDDWPTVNFIIKKNDFEKAGGFDTTYWPGEDTKLCLEIKKKLAKKIIYVPNLVVYHHRREGFFQHLKQTGGYGLHRGYFFRVHPENSRKFSYLYFMPSLLVVFLLIGLWAGSFSEKIMTVYLAAIAVYFFAIILAFFEMAFKSKRFWVSFLAIPFLISFHIWYGIRFIQGLVFTRNLKSKLGR